MQIASAEKIVLWDVQTNEPMKSTVDGTVAEFNKAGGEMEVVHIQNDPYKTKLKVAMGAGTPPDIFQNWGGGPLKEYVDAEMVDSIDEIKEDLLKTYIPAAFDPATFDGVTYGAPYSGLTGVYFWYRKDIFEQNGVKPPKTWTEFLQVCETLKKAGIAPIALANKNKWTGSFFYMYMADRVGGADMFTKALYRKDGVTFEDPGFVKAGEMLQDLVKKGYFVEGFNGMDEDLRNAAALLETGKAGMYLMGTWYLGGAHSNAPEVADQIDFFPFPAVEDGKGDPTNLIGSPGQDYLSISTTCKDKEAALKYLKEFIMNESWIQALVKNGLVPPVKNGADLISDPVLKKVAESFQAAGHVQVYYDQFLPPAMGEKHKDLVQALFGLTMTPEEVAKAHEAAMQEELKK
ncbi:carbohydrate ABC transporter substrate-binding protein, CUT1 family [Candidatus Moduliflexus flocculans]|uniref:Carbohydrate ABC transporter substrate-binding protein, CUT1 family n=1 Tax=Candidatus Moduliflexus flocculans TaxID=1499966 RepID=A0A0S6VR39_9BACT|nr:carbohydrate ABC transporter substrate-binding protein, CUT1 family [Candidatus Moduliflexus flocculans]